MLDCSIPKEQNLSWLDIRTPIMRDARLREEAHRAHVNYLEDHLFLGHQGSKIVLHFQPSKPNTLPPVVVVHKFFGWRPPWMISELSSNKCHCYVTMKVPWSPLTIWFNMQEQRHWCPSSFYKRSSTKRGHLHWECWHRWSACRYLHQAIWW
jgi:hypothetical protein